ncbi:hypothetical protein RHO15_07045 [Utexia brackfieldae]|uniref:hypothetical protein n=1 Tax=Utexia brackfieldae TaxID=3074108 RepID=UPI00370D58B0
MKDSELDPYSNNDAYNEWVDNKLKLSDQSDSNGIPHDELMEIIEAIIIKIES